MDIPHFEDALFLCGDSVILPQRADPGQTFKTLVFDESSVLSLRKESRSLDPPSERDPKGGKVPKSPSAAGMPPADSPSAHRIRSLGVAQGYCETSATR